MLIVNYTQSLIVAGLFFVAAPSIFCQDSFDEQATIDSVFNKVNQLDSVHLQIKELESQANYIFDFAPFTKIFIDSALALAKNAELEDEIAIAIFNQMQYSVFNAQYDSAMALFNRGTHLKVVGEQPVLQSDFHCMLATMRKKEGNAKAAIAHFMTAKRTLETSKFVTEPATESQNIDVKRSLCIIHNNLANLYQDVKDFPSAHREYGKAYELLISMDEKALAGTVWMNKGNIYLQEERFDSAYVIQLQAQKLKEEGDGSARSLAMSNLNVGNALLGLEKLEEAEQQFEKALSAFEELGNTVGLANIHVDLGRLFLKKELGKTAIRECELGRELAIESAQLEFQQKACSCLFEAYKTVGNYKLALQNHEQLKILHDSVRSNENTKYITQLEMQYDFDKAEEKRLIEEEATMALQIEKEKRNRRALVLLLVLLVSALLAAYLLYKNFQIKKRAESALSVKNSIISKALDEKQLLLKEIHHRVKNNLQVISSLLRLQSRYLEADAALDAITAGRSRVQSMALLHENLYQEDNLKGVDMQIYFDKLISGLFAALNTDEERIKLKKEIAPIQLDIDSVVPIGLIMNELITNALKHAFVGQEKGELVVRLYESEQKLHLEVSDNGKGMPTDYFDGKVTSFGHKLIRAFVNNLEADIEVTSDQGATVKVIINKYEKAA